MWCFYERSIFLSAVEKLDRFVDRSYAVGGQLLQHQRSWGHGCDCVPTKAFMTNTVAVDFIYYVVSSILVRESAWVDITAGC
jgi:hypothetical protein